MLANLPARLDDNVLAKVDEIARLPLPILPPAEEDFFLKCMRTLRLLPGRGDDDLSGELRLNLYRRHFGHLPRDAIAFLTEHATLNCRFFPTPVECRDILKKWERTDEAYQAQRFARLRARQEWERRYEETMDRLRAAPDDITQAEIDDLPERWASIAETRGYLRRLPDRSYELRRPITPPTTEEPECPPTEE